MKIKTLGGICVFGVCISLASLRGYILEMEHVAGIDTAYYMGLISGAMVMLAYVFIRSEN